MAKIKLILDTRRPTKTCEYPVVFRFSKNSESYPLATGIYCSKDCWDFELDKVTGVNAKRINLRLEDMAIDIDDAIYQLKKSGEESKMSARELRDYCSRNCNILAKSYKSHNKIVKWNTMMSMLINYRDKQKLGTYEVYDRTKKALEKFDVDINSKSWEDIDFAYLTDFDNFCRITMTINSVSIIMRCIRAIYNLALDNDLTENYPFRKFKIKQEQTRKRALTIDQLRELRDWEFAENDWRIEYRDIFMLIFYLIGINSVDLFSAKGSQVVNGRLEYRRAKTHKLYSVKIEPEAAKILEKYKGVNYLIAPGDRYASHTNYLAHLNDGIKAIGRKEGKRGEIIGNGPFAEISTYWARHTWATIAYEIGISVDIIGQALGHSNDNHSTTMIYIQTDRSKVDKANRKVIDYLNRR